MKWTAAAAIDFNSVMQAGPLPLPSFLPSHCDDREQVMSEQVGGGGAQLGLDWKARESELSAVFPYMKSTKHWEFIYPRSSVGKSHIAHPQNSGQFFIQASEQTSYVHAP